jgi:predicted nucleic acid-binding protein
MRVVVDTSIWSLALRRHTPLSNPETVILRKMIDQGESIFLLGIILQEILQGVKLARDFARLRDHLEAFPLLPVRREHYVKAAELRNHLTKKGVQAGTVDALIASAAISHDCYLFTNDKDFQSIARHSGLKLLDLPRP